MTRSEMESRFPEGSGFYYRGSECNNVKYGKTGFMATYVEIGQTEYWRYSYCKFSFFSHIPKAEFDLTQDQAKRIKELEKKLELQESLKHDALLLSAKMEAKLYELISEKGNSDERPIPFQ